MTDPDETALYRAVVRDPDDDTARLVYADYLQENGRTREGEFVRAQCRLAATDPTDPEFVELRDREDELRLWLVAHSPGPRPTFPGGLCVEGGRNWWKWTRRGFPRFLEFDGYERPGVRAMRALAAGLARAFDALPTRWLVVRYVTVAQLAALLKQPVLAGLSHLTVQLDAQGTAADDAARALAACRHLKNLRGLSLAFGFGPAGCDALAGAHWQQLEWFSSAGYAVTAAGLPLLATADWFRRLRALTLDALTDEAFEVLARLRPFPRLHTLELALHAFRAESWRVFARTRTFPALARLELPDGELNAGRLDILAGAGGFDLRVLNINRCEAGTAAALVAAPWARSLRVLNLAFNALGPAETKVLAACRSFADLRHLDLSANEVGPAALAALANNPALRALRALRLVWQAPGGLTPAHLDRFLTKLNTPDLRHLDLSGLPVGATAARKLAAPKFASLTRLSLQGCRLTDAAVAALLAAPALRNLIQLELNDNGLKTGPKALADPAVLPELAACSLSGNPIAAAVARKLRSRAGVTGLPKRRRA